MLHIETSKVFYIRSEVISLPNTDYNHKHISNLSSNNKLYDEKNTNKAS